MRWRVVIGWGHEILAFASHFCTTLLLLCKMVGWATCTFVFHPFSIYGHRDGCLFVDYCSASNVSPMRFGALVGRPSHQHMSRTLSCQFTHPHDMPRCSSFAGRCHVYHSAHATIPQHCIYRDQRVDDDADWRARTARPFIHSLASLLSPCIRIHHQLFFVNNPARHVGKVTSAALLCVCPFCSTSSISISTSLATLLLSVPIPPSFD